MSKIKALILAVSMGIAMAAAAPAIGAEENAIQETITQQIEAFRADDGDAAYSFAAPMIQQMFPSSDIFMSMVRQGYQPVYRPQSFDFSQIEINGGSAIQNVDIIGPKGAAWRAVYTLQKQANGQWKITGVQLVKSDNLGV